MVSVDEIERTFLAYENREKVLNEFRVYLEKKISKEQDEIKKETLESYLKITEAL